LAYRDLVRETCPQCGTRAEEWPDEDDLDGVDPYVTTTVRCRGCEAIADAQAEVSDGPDGRGVKVALVPPSVKQALRIATALRRKARQ
jgi:hypothetical protein